jgi:hypothetical protein
MEEPLPTTHRYEMDSGKGEYLVKDVSDAARMLPASLFGRVFADSDIVTPLSQLKIPLAYLPPANLAGMTARARRPTVPWYSVHNYNNIQVWKGGKAAAGPCLMRWFGLCVGGKGFNSQCPPPGV